MTTATTDPAWLIKARAEGRLIENGIIPPAAPPIVETISEKEFQAEVIAFAKSQGWKYYHTHDSRKCVEGFPDLILLRDSVLIVAELKVGDNRPTAAQLNWLDWFAAAGVKAFIWHPSNWPIIRQLLAAGDAPTNRGKL